MVNQEPKRLMKLGEEIMACMDYSPNDEQTTLIAAFAHFCLNSADTKSVFLLNGYAGTGKTSLTGAMVKALTARGMKTILLAPTGRAAKIFNEYSGHAAFTIHRKIYRQRQYMDEGFGLAENKHTNTLFIVDEASMISNTAGEGAFFGTGRLLDDLITYVYSGKGCRLVLMGDAAQLPPVGQIESPALQASTLSAYGLKVYNVYLKQIARQAQQSGILFNATILRRNMDSQMLVAPHLQLKQFADIEAVSSEFLMEKISDCYDNGGLNDTIVVTRSNRRATMFNGGIRNQILYREDELVNGDMLIVSKNNYHWAANYDNMDFIANGDVVCIKRVWGEIEHRYGLRFANVTVEFPDHDNTEIDVKIILDRLLSDTPALSQEQNEKMYNEIMESLTGDKRHRYAALKQDPYFNALQVKYAYAVTCHKAQGGQWRNVFIDMGGIMPDAMGTMDFYRWLYTAITRARNNVFLINSPLEAD